MGKKARVLARAELHSKLIGLLDDLMAILEGDGTDPQIVSKITVEYNSAKEPKLPPEGYEPEFHGGFSPPY